MLHNTQYLNDSQNCCIARRDCQGGACIAGVCRPVTIVADATKDARAIRVAGDWVLWATGSNSHIRRCAKDGSGNVPLPKAGTYAPTLDARGDYVYWIEYIGPYLNATRIDGTEAAKVVAEVIWSGSSVDGGTGADFGRLAVDDHNAYWAMRSPPSVWFAPRDGDRVKATALASVADAGVVAQEPAVSPYGVAVDSANVYWSDPGGDTIKRRALATLGTDQRAGVVISGEQGPGDIALDERRLYWLTEGGLVRSCAKVGACIPETLASGQVNPEFLIVDDQYVYWTSYSKGGNVSRVRKEGGRQEVGVLASSPEKWPWGIAQDCRTIYWTNHNVVPTATGYDFLMGEVMKVAK